MDNQEIIKKVQKCIWDWRVIHGELSEVISELKESNKEAYKIVIKIARVEAQLIEQGMLQFIPLFQKLKETLLK